VCAPFVPYIAAGTVLPEFSWRAVLLGTILGAIFGASSLYLVLKVGLTVSASIPVAVISMTLFKVFKIFGAKDASILENNIAQTAGSAGESIAFGVGVTMPAIMILGFDLELMRVALVSVLGALLGILMMIPLRRALIVAQHGKLKYPEGTACAEVLKAGASAEPRRVLPEALAGRWPWARRASRRAPSLLAWIGLAYRRHVGVPAVEGPPEDLQGAVQCRHRPNLARVLGVGYIIGPQVASLMVGGGILRTWCSSHDQVLLAGITGVLPRASAHRGHGPGPDPRRLRAVHRRGRSGRCGHHQPVPLPRHPAGLKEGLRDARGGSTSPLRTDCDLDSASRSAAWRCWSWQFYRRPRCT
jgi:hypothetical protein